MAHKLSPSHEDYLEAIYDLSQGSISVRSVDVATRLGVSRASVNKAVGLLRDAKLIDQQPYGGITLTEQGHALAAQVRRCHTILRTFLEKILGVAPEVAEDEACHIEHSISDDTLEKLASFVEKTLGVQL